MDLSLPLFDRTWPPHGGATQIGGGSIGGKAQGLVRLGDILDTADLAGDELAVSVPTFTVLGTDVFDAFMERNNLREAVESADSDARLAHAFQKGALPTEVLGDLRALIGATRLPLAVRSSSLLEDALFRPFAGVYETKMTPNNQPDANTRFNKLVEAIKFVYASAFFSSARRYLASLPESPGDDKMAVIIQNVAGEAHGERFYPNLSGVARTFNFYPLGESPREDGIVELALGLGKIIVDEGVAYPFVPTAPRNPPPFGSVREQVRLSQNTFWAVTMGRPPAFDPIQETEYLVRANLADADYDGALDHVASTYDPESDRLWPGVGRPGPRVVTFAPLLRPDEAFLTPALSGLMRACRSTLDADVELEFALTFPPRGGEGGPRLHAVQVRPMVTPEDTVEVTAEELRSDRLILASERVMGNGQAEELFDVVYVKPESFDFAKTPAVAAQLAELNRELTALGRPYLLIGFGRWGSSDPWLGIPVDWGRISGARVIVEASREERIVEASQGTHFFHNITSFGVSYFHIDAGADPGIRWDVLGSRPPVAETELVRHVRFDSPVLVKVDGRRGVGGVWMTDPGENV